MNDPSFAYFPQRLCALLLASGLAVTAHAQTAAVPELQRAEQAVVKAQRADADHYASDLLELARQTLVQAQTAALSSSRRERREAAPLALRAEADADLARVRSELAQVEAAVQARRNEVDELRQRLGLATEGAR